MSISELRTKHADIIDVVDLGAMYPEYYSITDMYPAPRSQHYIIIPKKLPEVGFLVEHYKVGAATHRLYIGGMQFPFICSCCEWQVRHLDQQFALRAHQVIAAQIATIGYVCRTKRLWYLVHRKAIDAQNFNSQGGASLDKVIEAKRWREELKAEGLKVDSLFE